MTFTNCGRHHKNKFYNNIFYYAIKPLIKRCSFCRQDPTYDGGARVVSSWASFIAIIVQLVLRLTYVVDVVTKTLGQWSSFQEQTVVLVWWFWETHTVWFFWYGFSVGYNRVRFLEWDASMIFLEILQANLEVKLSGTSNDVLSGFLDDALKQRILKSVKFPEG